MKSILRGLAAALLLAAPAAAKPSAADLAAIAAYEAKVGSGEAAKPLVARMAELKVPGVSIAFIENGKVKWTRAYGVVEAGGPRAVTPETLFQAASMSKPVAAAAALRLVEQGRLELDQDVNARLRSWKVPAGPFTATEKVTLRRLLSHTAGLTVSGFPGYVAGAPVPTDLQMLEGRPPSNTPAIRSFEPPGAGFAYSGGGYVVAQLMMVEATGETFPALIDRLVLRPAGMRRSTFLQPLPSKLLPMSASGHNPRGEVIKGARNTYPEYAAASLWTTAGDYGRFMIALQDSHFGRGRMILRQASVREMMTPVGGPYALGLVMGLRGGRPTFEHGGGNAGFQCNSFAFLDGSRQGLVVMTNSDVGGRLAGEIFRVVGEAYGWPAPTPTAGAFRRAPYVPAPPK